MQRVAPNLSYTLAHRVRKLVWEERWSRENYLPAWRNLIPPEVQQAVESGWFPARSMILDIGCGGGEIAAWLAERGFTVIGID
jgi:2-polyprenyl-3-methyl-5-hydroxy-6-metoxy-1,4-benzoquinol methylase